MHYKKCMRKHNSKVAAERLKFLWCFPWNFLKVSENLSFKGLALNLVADFKVLNTHLPAPLYRKSVSPKIFHVTLP